jgi:hypothetical protein
LENDDREPEDAFEGPLWKEEDRLTIDKAFDVDENVIAPEEGEEGEALVIISLLNILR